MDLQGQSLQATSSNTPNTPGMPLRDLGSFVYQSSVSDAEIKGKQGHRPKSDF